MPELVLPDSRYMDSFLRGLSEFHAEGRNLEWKIDELFEDFGLLIERLDKNARSIDLPEGHVPSTQFWLVDGKEYLGRVNIRHRLSPALERMGGHIGYEVRPSERRKGYGHLLLSRALPLANQMFKVDPALVTCDASNAISRRIIEAAGGALAPSIDPDELRFWVPTL